MSEDRSINWGNADRIISGRYRLDEQWGWQCICGNNDIMTKQEIDEISNPQSPDPKEIFQIIKDLKPQPSQFIMQKF